MIHKIPTRIAQSEDPDKTDASALLSGIFWSIYKKKKSEYSSL